MSNVLIFDHIMRGYQKVQPITFLSSWTVTKVPWMSDAMLMCFSSVNTVSSG